MQRGVNITKKTRQLAFAGWLLLPLTLSWLLATLFSLNILWWGPTWFTFAMLYMVLYFRWVASKKIKPRDQSDVVGK